MSLPAAIAVIYERLPHTKAGKPTDWCGHVWWAAERVARLATRYACDLPGCLVCGEPVMVGPRVTAERALCRECSDRLSAEWVWSEKKKGRQGYR